MEYIYGSSLLAPNDLEIACYFKINIFLFLAAEVDTVWWSHFYHIIFKFTAC